jgi:FkbM family methyltransferase
MSVAGCEARKDPRIGQLIAELVAEPRDRMIERVEKAFDRVAFPYQESIVLFGCGYLGKWTLPRLRHAGIEPLAFCDNDSRLWGSDVSSVPVLSPHQAVSTYRDSAVFVATIYNSAAVRNQLEQMGVTRVVSYPLLFWKFSEFIPDERLDLPHRILEHTDDMGLAFELLADEASRQEFLAQLRWRCLLDRSCLPRPLPPQQMYFPEHLFQLSDKEVFVDCGAYDGDSLHSFLDRVEGHFGKIYAFEPDGANFRALEALCASLPPEIARRITLLPYAVGKQNGTVHFAAEGSAGSKVVESGGTTVLECRTLDTVLLDEEEPPTLIKMDIEGAEVDAIPGARQVIERCRPVLAICAYHHSSDLWTLPRLIAGSAPDYPIYLRRHAEDCWETIYYGVPRERVQL